MGPKLFATINEKINNSFGGKELNIARNFNNKTTGVRIIPVYGKTIGDRAEFGGLLGRAPIMKINQNDSSIFINRGGQIPAPIHSFKN